MKSIGLAFVLAGALAAAAAPTLAQSDLDAAPSPNPHASLDLDGLEATRSQPLFTPSRAPPVVVEEVIEPEVVEAEPEPEIEEAIEPPMLQLVGVIMTEAQQVAILVDESTGEVHRLRAGEAYDDWTLSIVDPRSVAFEYDGERHALTLFTEFGRGSMSAHEAAYEDNSDEYDPFAPENYATETDGQSAEDSGEYEEPWSEESYSDEAN